MHRIVMMCLRNLFLVPPAYIKLCHYAKHTDKYPELKFEEINTSELSTRELKQAISQVGNDSILIYIVMVLVRKMTYH